MCTDNFKIIYTLNMIIIPDMNLYVKGTSLLKYYLKIIFNTTNKIYINRQSWKADFFIDKLRVDL